MTTLGTSTVAGWAKPTRRMATLAARAAIAHEHGALLVVDNTFMSPYLQVPLDLGADIVVHSLTEFLDRHGDVGAGTVVARTEELHRCRHETPTVSLGGEDPEQDLARALELC